MMAGRSTTRAMMAVRRNASTEFLRLRCQAEKASMTTRAGDQ